MLISTLQQIGLNEKQAKIYLACLELGETSIKEIAKKAEIKRTTIYDIIDEMINSGYIKITTKGKKKRFIAINPDDLKIIIRKKEAMLAQILPDLKAISNIGGIKPKILFYEGIDGLKKTYDDTLGYRNEKMYQWASSDTLNIIGEEWLNNYIKRRVKKKIKALCVASDSEEIRQFKRLDKEQLREIRIIDPKKFPFKIEINIYGNRVAMISARDKIGIIIESEPIVNTLKMIFKLCWSNLPKNY